METICAAWLALHTSPRLTRRRTTSLYLLMDTTSNWIESNNWTRKRKRAMNQEMKNRLLRLNSEALVEILKSVCGYAEIELNFDQDPDNYTNEPVFYAYEPHGGSRTVLNYEPVFYAYEPHGGSWTVLNYDPVLHDKPKHNIDIVDTLRRNPLYIPTNSINSYGRPQMGFELTSFNLIAADEIERLRSQRDEARREACGSDGGTIGEAMLDAEQRGWDCFKENTDGR